MLKGVQEKWVTEKSHYVDLFQSSRKKLFPGEAGWVSSLREKAIRSFDELDFPTQRLEEWKYTNVAPIATSRFPLAAQPSSVSSELERLDQWFGGSCQNRLVFVNGFYSKDLSKLAHLPSGAKVLNLSSALKGEGNTLESYLARYASFDRNAFTALNTAFLNEGALIYLPPEVTVEEPIFLLFLAIPEKEGFLIQPRNLIVAGRASRVTVVECYAALSSGRYFTNAVTEIVPGEGSSVAYLKIQREGEKAYHVASTQVYSNRASRFSSFYFDRGGALARNNLHVLLDAEACECRLDGLYLVAGDQHVDNTTVIDHAKPRGMSRQLYKGILDGRSRGVFSGKIFVRKGAQKTDAEQKNKNLLLSEHAAADTRPQLEIFADDVKCAHGAAVGQLDEEQLFYVKSRGLSKSSAEKLLTYGFASEVLSRVPVEAVRAELDQVVTATLEAGRGGGGGR